MPFRIFKDARKDKGQDDFLGNVVLRLKVSATVHPLLQVTPQALVKPHGVRAGSQHRGSTESLGDYTSFIFNPILELSNTASSCPINAVGPSP